MIEIGRLCLKIAGRDAGMKCVVVDTLDKNLVLIDGETRRRKCNIMHLEPLAQMVDISKGASHAQVASALAKLGIAVVDKKPRAKAAAQKTNTPAKTAAAKPAMPKIVKKE